MRRLRALQTCIWFTGTLKSELKESPERNSATWVPSNLVEGEWWYWRVRAADSKWIESQGKFGEAGPWSEKGAFYTHFGEGMPKDVPPMPPGALEMAAPAGVGYEVRATGPAAAGLAHAADLIRDAVATPDRIPDLVEGERPVIGVVDTPRPALLASSAEALPAGWEYYFAVDTDPNFTSPWIQRSTDEPWLFRAIKPNLIAAGTVVGLGSYILLSAFGLPILLVFGYVRALTTIPHWMITEVIGAMLARYYFWNRYGRQQWRTYAPVLAVGFACGMALMGMASISIALIQKSVSVLIF